MRKKAQSTDIGSLRWVVTRVNGKVASVSLDFKGVRNLLDFIVKNNVQGIESINTEILSMKELADLGSSLSEDDIILFGTDFQKSVWSKLFSISHNGEPPKVMSYSEFAEICGNRPGIRAVAHAVGLNPIAFIIPCHRIIPKACIKNIEDAYEAAIDTIFKGKDLYVFNAFDFGEYSLGKQLKRDLLAFEFSSTIIT